MNAPVSYIVPGDTKIATKAIFSIEVVSGC
jgi:hypothetical protein